MTDIQIDIAIHEARGFKQVEPKQFRNWTTVSMAFEKDGAYYGGPPPRYTGDLNEIRKAMLEEDKKNPNFVIEYERALHTVLRKNPMHPKKPFYWLASAQEQAEAFVLYWKTFWNL